MDAILIFILLANQNGYEVSRERVIALHCQANEECKREFGVIPDLAQSREKERNAELDKLFQEPVKAPAIIPPQLPPALKSQTVTE